jgi:hypothetical protein
MGNPYKNQKRVKVAKKAATTKQEESLYDSKTDFNPTSFDGSTKIAKALGNQNRMFDDKGEVNAYDKKDALQQIAHLLNNVLGKEKVAKFRVDPDITPEARRDILAGALQDPTGEGHRILGAELLQPVKEVIDYEGWSRKILSVRPLAQGELFRISKDVDVVAWVVGQDGAGIESRVRGRYIFPPEFKIVAFPTIDIADIYQMNFDVLDRAQDRARQDIERKEDKALIAALDAASTTVNTVTNFVTLGLTVFEDIRYQVERHRLVVDKFLINRQEVSDIVKTMSANVDPVTERELILAGYIGTVLNCQIITSAGTGVLEVLPAGTVYGCTDGAYIGQIGERVSLFSEPFNKYAMGEMVRGWAFAEILGQAIANPKAVAKGTK